MRRTSLAALPLLLLAFTPSPAEEPGLHEPNAVLVNLTETDLNLVLRELFASAGGPHLTGHAERVSKGMFDLSYEADLSVPELTLDPDGRVSLALAIEKADARIGRLERRMGKRTVRCENAGIAVDPDRPLEMSFDLRFAIEDDGLRVVPESVRLDDARTDFRLIKPSRCENAPLPRWLLWWIGKPKLRRRVAQLDDLLLDRVRSGADGLNGPSGLLAKSWQGSDGETFRLFPRSVDTGGGSLLLTLAGATDEAAFPPADDPAWVAGRRSGSFLALSGAFLDRLAASTFPEGALDPHEPNRPLRKLLGSSSFYTLVPGLRGTDTSELSFTMRLRPPRITLRRASVEEAGIDPTLLGEPAGDDEPRAVLGLELNGVELAIWRERDGEQVELGALTIESGRIAVVPFFNRLGGISFELLENEWRLSSRGVEFNENVFAATLQELVFGEMFETRFEPLARGALHVGDAELSGRGFRVIDGYLVIEIGAVPPPAPTRTDTLRASR